MAPLARHRAYRERDRTSCNTSQARRRDRWLVALAQLPHLLFLADDAHLPRRFLARYIALLPTTIMVCPSSASQRFCTSYPNRQRCNRPQQTPVPWCRTGWLMGRTYFIILSCV